MNYTGPPLKNLKNGKYILHIFLEIWGADLADMQLPNKYNDRVRFLLYVIDIYSKYIFVVPLKDREDISITNAFQKVLEQFGCK